MHASGNIEGVTLRHSAGLAWRPRGRDPTPGDWNNGSNILHKLKFVSRASQTSPHNNVREDVPITALIKGVFGAVGSCVWSRFDETLNRFYAAL